MIWLVWRQHRLQALFAVLGLAVLAAFLVPTGLQMRHAFDRAGLDDCLPKATRVQVVQTGPGPGQGNGLVGACKERADQFTARFGYVGNVGMLLWFLPLLAGLFWGAPLVAREFEHGTHRLVWTQGVSRTRWALAKFGLVGGGVVLLAAGFALLVTWWRLPLDQASGRQYLMPGSIYDLIGPVPIGYALFA
ncbi:MAG TPA: transporter, partial [Actinomycetota bacterium]